MMSGAGDASVLKHRELTEKVIGVFYEVYNELGTGFLESVYGNAMALALAERGLSVEQEKPVPVYFRGDPVGDFRADLVVNGLVICELKAASLLDRAFTAQLLNYLRATDIEVGLLLNFGPNAEFKRMVFENGKKSLPPITRG
jgi:GxxExxY protein